MINEPSTPTVGTSICPQCGAQFVCGIAAGEKHCWCFDLPPVMTMSADTTCLCPDCLREAIEAKRKES
jgi:hypothetical protein